MPMNFNCFVLLPTRIWNQPSGWLLAGMSIQDLSASDTLVPTCIFAGWGLSVSVCGAHSQQTWRTHGVAHLSETK